MAAAIVALACPTRPTSSLLPPGPLPPHRGRVTQAAISPDGTRLVLVVDDELVIRGIEPDSEERTIVDHGIADKPTAWSPNGRHLLAAVIPEVATRIETEMIDVDGGARFKLSVTGRAVFLSSAEVAVTSPASETAGCR